MSALGRPPLQPSALASFWQPLRRMLLKEFLQLRRDRITFATS